MPTTITAISTQVFANRCGDNLLNKNLSFNLPFAANVASGSGTASTSTDIAYSGGRSLYVNNLSTTFPIVVNGGGTNWYNDYTGSYVLGTSAVQQFSIFNSMGSGRVLTGRLNIYVDAVLVYILEFTTESHSCWETFYAPIALYGNYDYSFELDNDPDEAESIECYLGGIKLEIDDKRSNMPSPYTGYVPKEFVLSEAVNVPSIADGDSYTYTATLTGAVVGDYVQVTYPAALLTAGLIIGQPIVTAANTVSFLIYNNTGGAVDPASGTYTFKIVR